ncbi:MAG TPA: hypothetical protein VGL29_16915 [Blastocatellia bacterium]
MKQKDHYNPEEAQKFSAENAAAITIWIVDAHRNDGKRFVVRANEKLAAFLELESATRAGQRFSWSDWLGVAASHTN